MSAPLSVRKGVAQSRDVDVAVRELREALEQPGIRLAFVYCAADFDRERLSAALAREFQGVELIGCTTAGEITPLGYLHGTLTGVSLASPSLQVATKFLPLDALDSAAIAGAVAQALAQLEGAGTGPASAADTFAFLLIDGLAMQEDRVVSAVYAQLRGISLIGGSAADDVRFESTHVFHDGRFHARGAVLALVRTDLPFVAFRAQHFTPTGRRMVVTRADASRRIVHEIDGLPAGREYARLLGLDLAELTPLTFACHPVVVRLGGQHFVRSIARVNEDESLTFFCAIDEGIVLTIAEGADMVDNLQAAFDSVRREIGPPDLVLGCDCVLRRLETEREDIKEKIGDIFVANNVVGFATYGEQFNAMHVNQTFTGIAIGSPR